MILTTEQIKVLIRACNDPYVKDIEVYKYSDLAAIHINYRSGIIHTFIKDLNAEESVQVENIINKIYEIKDNLLFEKYKELL